MLLPYVILTVVLLIAMVPIAYHAYKSKKKILEMPGMMLGMTFGMITSTIVGTFVALPTGDFLYGMIVGTIVGLLFGIPFGTFGGPLGIVEGVMASQMGGMMGAMLGLMIRPFNIKLFVAFFVAVILLAIGSTSYAIDCCICDSDKKKRKNWYSNKFVTLYAITGIIVLLLVLALPFSLNSLITQTANTSFQYVQNLLNQGATQATNRNDYQEVDLVVTASGYSPDVIIAKKGVPLKINAKADSNAGCAREIVFPDFNVDKIVPIGGSVTIEINPTKTGEFNFRCAMGMVWGKLVIIE